MLNSYIQWIIFEMQEVGVYEQQLVLKKVLFIVGTVPLVEF